MPHAKRLLCDHKNPYFSENIGRKVFSLIWFDILIHVCYLWVWIINKYNLCLILVYFSFIFVLPSSSLLSDFCHFFPFLSLSVPLAHLSVVWKILCFVGSYSYIRAHKLIISFNKQRFIMLPSSASWRAATHWGVILNSWSPLASPPILLFFPSLLPEMLLLSFSQVRMRDLVP